MPNTIKIKRRPAGGAAGKPSSLYNGELAFNESDNVLYYGYGSGVGGVASSIEQIGGSGYFAHRGGTNASGTWPISITGNSSTVTNGVYTTGEQNIGGIKRFTSQVEISGNVSPYLIFKSANAGNYGNIIFDGVNYSESAQSSYIASSTGNMEIAHGQKIQLNSALEVKAANTAGNSVEYFAVFDSNPASTLTTLKSVSKSQILDDIGAATSGLDITAGSGLAGGGTLSQNRRFDVGQGDGISVSDNAIAVDSTVVRTTGTQSIDGSKTFISDSGIYVLNRVNIYGSGSNQSLIFTNDDVNVGDITWDSDNSKLAINTSKLTVYTSNGFKSYGNNWFGNDGGLIGVGINVNPSGTFGSLSDFAAIQGFNDAVSSYNALCLTTQNGAQLYLNTDGNIGVGTATPEYKFDINGTANVATSLRINAQTANTIASFDSSKNIVSLSTSTYPTLTELSYVKGLTSAVQTQLDNKITKPSSTTSGNIPIWTVSNGTNLGAGYSVETVLVGGSTSIPRSDAVKTYVDNMIVSGIATNDAMIFKGAIDCSTNPNYPAADRGWTYKVSVAGTIGGVSGVAVEVNDTLICTTDGTSTGTHAAVGSNWVILQTNIADASILVTGPASATSGNFAIFDGTTGKIIKDASFSTVPVTNGGTGQTSYTDGQLLIGNTTGNTLTKATLTEGTGIDITNGAGSITITHEDTSTLTGAQGSNGIASITVDGLGHVTAVTTATYLTAGTVCAAIVDCSLDGGSF